MERVISFFGLFVMIALAWLLSSHRKRVPWRVVAGGLFLQFSFAFLVLGTSAGRSLFDWLGDFFRTLLDFVNEGSTLVFGLFGPPDANIPEAALLLRSFAFGILPTIIFFSALMSVLYHLRIMQLVVSGMAFVMQRTLGTSGAETLSAAANIFVGQTEAPLVIRPYVAKMTSSELMVVMVGGFATIAGGVMAAYVGMGINAGHLLTASVISAPAALLIAKVMQPEVETPETQGQGAQSMEVKTANVVEAAAEGASAGLHLALNVGAMLIAFVALIAMCNAFVGLVSTPFLEEGDAPWTLEKMFGYLFAPLAWVMGVEWNDCRLGGELLGIKWFATEFVAYDTLGRWLKPESGVAISDRSATILTYALCGFANFASIGIQIGGISSIAPERRSDLAKLGVRAMIGGTLAACMTGCIAGVLYTPDWATPNAPAEVEQPADDDPAPADPEPTDEAPADNTPDDEQPAAPTDVDSNSGESNDGTSSNAANDRLSELAQMSGGQRLVMLEIGRFESG